VRGRDRAVALSCAGGLSLGRGFDTLSPMSDKFDPNIELPPNPILGMVLVLVIAAFGTVGWIVFGEAASQATAPAGK
jgi:hypothetical protein